MEKENILGFDICNTDLNHITKKIFEDFDNNIKNFIVNINPEIVVNNYKNTEIINEFNSQNYQIPDGIGIIWASKKLHGNIKQRITGIDLMQNICSESINHDSKIFLYGGKENIADYTKQELKKSYPNINIVGTCNGYMDNNTVVNSIKKSGANILFVGLGSPKQEKFIINNKHNLPNIKIFMPIGRKF